MKINFPKNNIRSGFALLFAMMLGTILLALALGVSDIALKELVFSTSAKASNDAFFAADTGEECALYYDQYLPGPNRFVYPDPGGSISCANNAITPTFSGNASAWTFTFIVLNLGDASSPKACAKVSIQKSVSGSSTAVTVISDGYTNADSTCTPSASSLNRELQVNYLE